MLPGMKEIHFVDTTLRDGPSSLWAMGIRTDMMLPVAAQMDEAGFLAMEIIASAFFKKCVRELKDDPWARVRRVKERVPKTALRGIRNRYMAAFQHTPPAVQQLWLERLAANGISELRTSDPSNTPAVWAEQVRTAAAAGLETIVNLIFSISPKHTDEYYAERTRAAAKLRVKRICLKDPGGLFTPDRTRTLAPVVLANSGGIPVEFHTHCNSGLGPLCTLDAIEAGIPIINAALPPLSDGSSNPSLFNIVRNARALGYNPVIDADGLRPVSEHFTRVAKEEGLPIGEPLHYDAYHFQHQVPGGMISNLRHQLANIGMGERLGEVLDEACQVREEFGYPIMVTPYSQFVGSQCAINVILGKRYEQVTDEVILYAMGHWGEEEASSMDPDVRDRILDRPRARELRSWQPPDTSVKELREKLGGPGVSDDELLLRYFTSEEDVRAMQQALPRSRNGGGLVGLIRSLTERSETRQIYIRRPDLSVRLG
ncbi:MAG: carboxyltransferase [Deltaproteobacteria bacterium]|nr:carboxyltransferase [Deltaproteobacteria bacterium]